MLADPEDDRPIILVEFSQIRNSGGGLWKFIELVKTTPLLRAAMSGIGRINAC